MNIFQLLKQVLDDSYNLVEETDGPRDLVIKHDLGMLSTKYRDLRKYANIDYSEPSTRFAYVFKYVSSHANIVYTRIRLSRVLTELFARESVYVVGLGGGPGSELLGVVKYLQSKEYRGKLVFEIFDREPTWGETWSGVFERVETGIKVSPSFQTFDVTERKTWSRFVRYLQADLFMMIYFVSEVYGIKDEAEPYFDHLLSRAKKGALLLYVDNRVADFTNWIDAKLTQHGWEVLESEAEELKTPGAEERRDLGIYFQKFGSPKLVADVAWRLARKK